ncbi:MAG TPA: hypothetical protein VM694_02555 [Polyangium sp.]|uniref:Uncharacterized protein n=1 Tax=Polyangium mundeleinium TaxID=2995306 RepID=A0ABT5EGI8_9BACT|nr:hypothetical protein [Polyangium mundeleinium]MDC0740467.1 hypothetical protein [Polyangium mundeleinium]HVK63324.1 hypothetical protein [Polyangium sp.]
MNQRSARVIDLDEVRRRRADEQRQKAQSESVVLVWVPVWFWVPVWPAM